LEEVVMATTFTLEPDKDIRNVHGAPSWFELATPEPERAAEFLGAALGWTFEQMEVGGEPYRVIRVAGHEAGGIRGLRPGENGPAWTTYVTVADVDAVVADAAGAGGQVVAEPFDVPGVGRLAVVSHPDAGMLHAVQYVRPFQ
jgi:uncharacterized protein